MQAVNRAFNTQTRGLEQTQSNENRQQRSFGVHTHLSQNHAIFVSLLFLASWIRMPHC